MLRSDLSGPEIAHELHVSLNTLRTHTRRIYTKLGATSRRHTLRHATEAAGLAWSAPRPEITALAPVQHR